MALSRRSLNNTQISSALLSPSKRSGAQVSPRRRLTSVSSSPVVRVFSSTFPSRAPSETCCHGPTTRQRDVITLCHGPACLLAADASKPEGSKYMYDSHKFVVFLDPLIRAPTSISDTYLAKRNSWSAKHFQSTVWRSSTTVSQVHRDRYLLTGDSLLAPNNLGKLAASVSIQDAATRPAS